MKIIWSIGGWSYSRPFFDVCADAGRRSTFIKSVIRFITNPAIAKISDGIDIDYEYPGGGGVDPDKGNAAIDGANYITMMTELRAALD